jgi:hypothetical protein
MFKNFFQQFSNQMGISLLLAILISALILGSALGVSTILLQETKMGREMGNSVVAFYAAETGIEQILMTKQNPSTSCLQSSPCQLANGASYYLSILTPGAACSASNFCIKSIGIFKETRRGIEVKY